jgi:dolichyl-phosphate-mannose--protein O-mannosyl transferase
VDYTDATHTANIYAQGNPVLHLVGPLLIVFTFLVVVSDRLAFMVNALSKKKQLLVSTFESYLPGSTTSIIFIMVTYAWMWMPWIFSPRIMFYYHYTPAVPFLCMIVAYWLYVVWHHASTQATRTATNVGKVVVALTLVSIFAAFVVWYPHWTDMPVPNWWMNSVYFSFAGWK